MRIFKFLILVLVLFFVIASFFQLPRFVKIKNFTCKNQYGDCSQEVVVALEKLKGRDLTSFKKEAENILSENNLVKKYALQFKLPPSYDINILEKVPKYAIVEEGVKKYALVNGDREVIQIVRETNLPKVVIKEELPQLGDKVNDKTFFALKIIYDLYFSFQTHYGIIENDHLLIELDHDIKVIFPLEGDGQVLIGSLNLILNRLNGSAESFKIEDTRLGGKTIDLRYKNPVIR